MSNPPKKKRKKNIPRVKIVSRLLNIEDCDKLDCDKLDLKSGKNEFASKKPGLGVLNHVETSPAYWKKNPSTEEVEIMRRILTEISDGCIDYSFFYRRHDKKNELLMNRKTIRLQNSNYLNNSTKTIIFQNPYMNNVINTETELHYTDCSVCGVPMIKIKRCSRCKKVYYCSVKCQKLDWKNHKIFCF